ncbi:MAG: hypothetical protein R6T91_04325, partial [Bacteroidales bacterium]
PKPVCANKRLHNKKVNFLIVFVFFERKTVKEPGSYRRGANNPKTANNEKSQIYQLSARDVCAC